MKYNIITPFYYLYFININYVFCLSWNLVLVCKIPIHRIQNCYKKMKTFYGYKLFDKDATAVQTLCKKKVKENIFGAFVWCDEYHRMVSVTSSDTRTRTPNTRAMSDLLLALMPPHRWEWAAQILATRMRK